MPTYDYHCKACDSRMEIFQSIKARPLRKCPVCGKNALERLIGSGSGIIFRGSGFYETDYRSSSYKAQASKESSAASTSSASSSSSSSSSGASKDNAKKTSSDSKKKSATKSSKSGDLKAAS